MSSPNEIENSSHRADASLDERERWNRKYRESARAELEPDPFLLRAFEEFIRPRFPHAGRAVDFAGGAGRHAIWLARLGWEVTLIDISDAGIEQARQKAGPVASHINFVLDDLTRFRSSQTQFDLAMVFLYLERSIFPEIVSAIRPGGLLVYKSYTIEQAQLEGEPNNPAFLLQSGELLQLARGLRVLHYSELVRDKATAELVAIKA